MTEVDWHVLARWPKHANQLLSLAFVFFAGLFTDWATAGGVVGQWALIFTVIWGVMRPELRNSPYAPLSLFTVWLAICGLVVVLLSVLGWFVFGALPDYASLGRQMIFTTLLLPFIVLLRRGVALRFRDSEDWGA